METDSIMRVTDPETEEVVFTPYGATAPPSWTPNTQVFYRPSQVYYQEEKSKDVEGPKSMWKPFQHYKMLVENPQKIGFTSLHPTTTWNVDQNDSSFGMVGAHDWACFGLRVGTGGVGEYDPRSCFPSLKGQSSEDALVHLPASIDVLVQAALNAKMPYVRTQLSTLNSLYELKDFRSMAVALRRCSSTALRLFKDPGFRAKFQKQVFSRWGIRRSGRERGLTGSNILGLRNAPANVAEAFLSWKFAIAPLLSDIAAVKRAAKSFKREVEKLLRDAEKVRRVHHSVEFVEDSADPKTWKLEGYTVGPSTPYYYPMHGPNSSYVYSDQKPSVFHWECEYSYSYFAFQSQYADLLGFLDALGVNFNPMAIIWNALPWTFVVDWFVNIGKLLDSFKFRALEPVIVIHRCCYSVTRTRRMWGLYKPCYPYPGYVRNGDIVLPPMIETAYRRSIDMPSGSSLITSGLSSDEFILGSALALVRTKKRKNRGLLWPRVRRGG